MAKHRFIKHIKQLDEDTLRKELQVIYSKFKVVQDHYALELGEQSDRNKVYKKAQQEIKKKFQTRGIRKPKLPRIRLIHNIIRNLEKITVFDHELIETYLYTAECGLDYIRLHYLSNAALNRAIKEYYDKACSMIQQCQLEDAYSRRCYDLSRQHGIYLLKELKLQSIYLKYFKALHIKE